MKICVVGGAGYIGSHVVLELVKKDYEVIVIDNLSTGLKEMIDPKAKFYKADITNTKEIEEIFKKEKNIKFVIHLAAKLIVPESIDKPLEYYHNNVEGVRSLLEAMVNTNIKNIVFSSTAATYGEAEGVLTESTLTNPITPYGETKLVCENMIKWVTKRYNMNYCIFRYFNVAGADESLKIGLKKDNLTHLIPVVVQTALGIRDKMLVYGNDYKTPDGTCVRDYIHVSDLADAHLLAIEYIEKNNKSILCNLGSGKGYSVKEIIEAVNKIKRVNYEIVERRPGDPALNIASNKLAKEKLGWVPKRNLDIIIKSDMDFRAKRGQ